MKKIQINKWIILFCFLISFFFIPNKIMAQDVDECANHEYCPAVCGCEEGSWTVGGYYACGTEIVETDVEPYWKEQTKWCCDFDPWDTCCNYDNCEEEPTPQPTEDPPAPTDPPPPTAAILTGSFMLTDSIDPDAGAFSCSITGASALVLPSANLNAYYSGTYDIAAVTTISNQSIFSLNLFLNQTFDIYLTLPADSNYICSCPASMDDGQKRCAYFNVTVTAADEEQNFYLMDASTSNQSWFQVFDGGAFANNQIETNVPYLSCDLSASCTSAIFTQNNNNFLSIGFPSIFGGSSSSIQSSNILGNSLDYIHSSDRSTNTDSYLINQRLNQFGYSQLLQMAQTSGITVNTLSANELKLADLRSGGQIDPNRDNFFLVEGDLAIDENNQLAVNSGENLTIFVNGNLTISDDGADQSKITQVASKTAAQAGGFLALIVSGDLTIDGSVGRQLDPITPNLPVVSAANAQLEGVFLADGVLTIASSGSYPDHKFIGAGTFVGWSGVELDRQVEDPSDDSDNANRVLNNNQALDNFIYRPDLLANWPTELKTSIINWREVSPQQISQ